MIFLTKASPYSRTIRSLNLHYYPDGLAQWHLRKLYIVYPISSKSSPSLARVLDRPLDRFYEQAQLPIVAAAVGENAHSPFPMHVQLCRLVWGVVERRVRTVVGDPVFHPQKSPL